MPNEASLSAKPSRTIIIAQDAPAEVMDSGKVRMGGGVHICWLASEILHYLPGLVRYWPNLSC
jgi:hypothetical protein